MASFLPPSMLLLRRLAIICAWLTARASAPESGSVTSAPATSVTTTLQIADFLLNVVART